MLEFILIVLVFLLSAIYLRQCWKSRGLPPGPMGLPLLGYEPFLGSDPLKTYDALVKKYGELFTIQMGTENWIFLNSRELINKVFVKNRKSTSDRPQILLLDILTNDLAISGNSGAIWKCHRDFVIKSLKTFGARAMEKRVLEEAEFLCKALEEKRGETFECQEIISKAVVNVFWSVLMSSRASYDDERFIRIASVLIRGGTASDHFQTFLNAPFLRYFPYYKNKFRELVSSGQYVVDEIEKSVDEHAATVDENCPRDFVDHFLLEMRKENKAPSFTKKRLTVSMYDMLAAGTGTTTHTLGWCVLALVAHPQYQKLILQEIVNIIGRDELSQVSLKHKEEMHFTVAFLNEIWRHRPPVPLGLPHVSSEDFSLKGYRVPSKTQLIVNIWSLQHNPQNFQDPNEFRPERFLDEQGRFNPSENLIPFSLGGRRCLGEQLARMESFIFFTKIVQNFEVFGDQKMGSKMFEDGVLALTYGPRKCAVEFRKRTPGSLNEHQDTDTRNTDTRNTDNGHQEA